MYSLILVPLDGSEPAGAALETAAELARRFQARLLLVQVVSLTASTLALGANVAAGGLGDPVAAGMELTAEVDAARAHLSATAEQLAATGLTVDYEVREGAPGQSILDAAAQSDADLIVMGSHGRGALGRIVFGSVAGHVVQHAHMPVLVVRGRPEDESS